MKTHIPQIEALRYKAFRVTKDACPECWGTGEVTYFQDGTISPGLSSSSTPCERKGCKAGKRVAAEWNKKWVKS
jgi:excinuclease UvrABC ATPase subunit